MTEPQDCCMNQSKQQTRFLGTSFNQASDLPCSCRLSPNSFKAFILIVSVSDCKILYLCLSPLISLIWVFTFLSCSIIMVIPSDFGPLPALLMAARREWKTSISVLRFARRMSSSYVLYLHTSMRIWRMSIWSQGCIFQISFGVLKMISRGRFDDQRVLYWRKASWTSSMVHSSTSSSEWDMLRPCCMESWQIFQLVEFKDEAS